MGYTHIYYLYVAIITTGCQSPLTKAVKGCQGLSIALEIFSGLYLVSTWSLLNL